MLVQSIILASQSPYRKSLLLSTGLDFVTIESPIDEEKIVSQIPEVLARSRAEAKAKAVSAMNPDSIVIGCDQVLSFEDRPFGKVKSAFEATSRLKEFSGREHSLLSAFCLFYSNKLLHSEIVEVVMKMRDLTDEELRAYVATNEWKGCAGCYQYENRGGLLFESSETSLDSSSIIGLPIRELNSAFLGLGIKILTNPKGPWLIKNM